MARRVGLVAGFAALLLGAKRGASAVTGFEENRGQTDRSVAYVARTGNAILFLTGAEAVWRAGEAIVRMRAVAGRPTTPAGVTPLAGLTHYIGRSTATVASFAQVRYTQIYPGIDLVFHNEADQLEYDFIVKPDGDAASILLKFEGQEALAITPGGDLRLVAAGREFLHQRPVAFQRFAHGVRKIAARYVLRGTDQVAFEVAAYDRTVPLVIDPVVVTSTYLGGSGAESGNAIARDPAGNVYVAGESSSLDFPTTSGAVQRNRAGDLDVFVTKLDPTGTQRLYATYVGGNSTDVATAIAVDGLGAVYVAGETASADFPVGAGAAQGAFRGASDAFAFKLAPDGGSLTYSTYHGGSGSDRANAIAVDATGAAYIAGRTSSGDLTTTAGALQRFFRGGAFDAFVAKLNPAGSALTWSSYLGGNDNDAAFGVAVDAVGNTHVAGGSRSSDFPTTANAYSGNNLATDGFLVKLNAAATGVVYSTFLGGSFIDRANALAITASGSVWVAGWTSSTDFPSENPTQPVYGGGPNDAFVSLVDPSRPGVDSLVFSTFFGGSDDDRAHGIATSGDGAVIAGQTSSTDLPVTRPLQPAYGGGSEDAFLMRLSATNVEYASWLGGTGDDRATAITAGGADDLWITGRTASADFPVTGGLQPVLAGTSDAFVTRVSGAVQPVPAMSPVILMLMAAVLSAVALTSRLHA